MHRRPSATVFMKGSTQPREGLGTSLLQLQCAPDAASACVGWRLAVHSFQPTFNSLTKNPRSANCRAAFADRCQSCPQQ